MRTTRLGDWVVGLGLLCTAAFAAADQAEVPQGYRIALQVLTEDGSVLEILEDLRITPQLHADGWGKALDSDSFDDGADIEHKPLLDAEVRLLSDSGEMLAQKSLGYPLATVEKAPLNGLPSPAFFLTIDQTAPMGTYSGPATEVLVPGQRQLDPVLYLSETGEKHPLVMAQTGKAAWQIVAPSSGGATEEIVQVSSASSAENEEFVTTYRTYRFTDGQWTSASRQQAGYW
ncbi:MAG: hypothetical protein NTV76_12840, partial [Pseudomonas sp.]|nr:hypothetical protein [Pseudomonas sp.]